MQIAIHSVSKQIINPNKKCFSGLVSKKKNIIKPFPLRKQLQNPILLRSLFKEAEQLCKQWLPIKKQQPSLFYLGLVTKAKGSFTWMWSQFAWIESRSWRRGGEWEGGGRGSVAAHCRHCMLGDSIWKQLHCHNSLASREEITRNAFVHC